MKKVEVNDQHMRYCQLWLYFNVPTFTVWFKCCQFLV